MPRRPRSKSATRVSGHTAQADAGRVRVRAGGNDHASADIPTTTIARLIGRAMVVVGVRARLRRSRRTGVRIATLRSPWEHRAGNPVKSRADRTRASAPNRTYSPVRQRRNRDLCLPFDADLQRSVSGLGKAYAAFDGALAGASSRNFQKWQQALLLSETKLSRTRIRV